MNWIINLFTNTESIAHISLLYAVVIAVGILLGKIKIGGISLGVSFFSQELLPDTSVSLLQLTY